MRIRDIMTPNALTLPVAQTFGYGFRLLMEKRIRSLPVVDEDGRYVGLFDLVDIWEVLLPKAATIQAGFLPNLAFANTSIEELRQKVAEAEQRPLREFLANEAPPTISPEAAVQEAMLLLYRQGRTLPVVDPATGKVAGIVAAWDVLNRVV